jgi:hypothetical protein
MIGGKEGEGRGVDGMRGGATIGGMTGAAGAGAGKGVEETIVTAGGGEEGVAAVVALAVVGEAEVDLAEEEEAAIAAAAIVALLSRRLPRHPRLPRGIRGTTAEGRTSEEMTAAGGVIEATGDRRRGVRFPTTYNSITFPFRGSLSLPLSRRA